MNKQEILEHVSRTIDEGPFKASWDSLEHYQPPAWYMDAKFGIFIHWGVYSVPAFGNEWYPRNMYSRGSPEYLHHLEHYGKQSEFGYKDFIPMFKGERFDAEEWASLFKKAGAKYVVPVGEHHDGFQMYDSDLSAWNACRMGPKRDVLGELSRAVRESGMVFGASSHRAEHWWYFNEGRKIDSDVNDPRFADFYGPAHDGPGAGFNFENYCTNPPGTAYLEDWLARTCELIEKYRPQVLYFDWWIMNLAFKPYLKKLAAFYYNSGLKWDRGVAINAKFDAFPVGAAVFDLERGQLANLRPLFWQTDTAVANNSWGYTEGNEYKTPEDIVCNLVDIVSKNGTLLLNIGPKSDGSIPDKDREILLAIGQWLGKNGEAIYGTRYFSCFGEGPTEVVDGSFNDISRKAFTSEDIRFTVKPGALYAVVMKRPEGGRVLIKTLAPGSGHTIGAIRSVSVLEDGAPCEYERTQNGLLVHTPKVSSSAFPVVLKILHED
jgi:alpha-L-fucosidase